MWDFCFLRLFLWPPLLKNYPIFYEVIVEVLVFLGDCWWARLSKCGTATYCWWALSSATSSKLRGPSVSRRSTHNMVESLRLEVHPSDLEWVLDQREKADCEGPEHRQRPSFQRPADPCRILLLQRHQVSSSAHVPFSLPGLQALVC